MGAELAVEVDFLLNAKEAKERGVTPDFFAVESSVGDDGVDDWRFFVGIEFFVAK